MAEENQNGKSGKILTALKKSPIDYFSDLFMCVAVLYWVVIGAIMTVEGIYSTHILQDTSMWSYVESYVSNPVSCGIMLWMAKNAAQHTIAYWQGRTANKNFTDDEETDDLDDEEVYG